MARPIPSHRVEILEEDETRTERPRFREKSPPRSSTSDRDRERERERDYHDRPYRDFPYHQHDYYRGHYPFPPHMYSQYHGPPVVYQPPQNHHSGNSSYGPPQQGLWDPQAHGFIQPHSHSGQQNSPQNGANSHATPIMQPQFLAVNVKTDTHQTQAQDQSQSSENKQITIKEKVIHNVSKGLEGLFDPKVLAVGVGTLVLQHLVKQAREHSKKGKKRGISLSLGLL